MKTKVLSQLVVILFIAAISCTKESSNISSAASATNRESDDIVAASLGNELNLPVVGKWTLYYDWSCTGKYHSTTLIVNADRTWSIPSQNYTGYWVKGRGIFLFTFNQLRTTYSGAIGDTKITGIMTTFQSNYGAEGCFYMAPAESSNLKQEEQISGTLDASGKQ